MQTGARRSTSATPEWDEAVGLSRRMSQFWRIQLLLSLQLSESAGVDMLTLDILALDILALDECKRRLR